MRATRIPADQRSADLLQEQAPASPREMSAEWLTSALHAAGALSNASVRSFTTEPIGLGLAGSVVRVRLEFDDPACTAPRSIIAKFSADPGPTRTLAERFDLYRREAMFYSNLAPASTLPLPASYYSSGGQTPFVLLLEDLEQRGTLNWNEGFTLERAAAVLPLIAEMHARHWNDPLLERQAWLPAPNNQTVMDLIEESSGRAWTGFRDTQLGSRPPRQLLRLGARVAHDRTVLDRLASPPWTLVHGDLRSHNIVFDTDDSTRMLAVIDWQTVMRARGAMDIASLFVTSLTPEDRRRAEHDLLPAYHRALLERGVRDYTFDACKTDYGLGVVNQFCQVIALYGLADVSWRIEGDVALLAGERLVAALLELNAVELVPPTGVADALESAIRRAMPRPLKRLLRSVAA